jgi:hypothetical protein
MLENRYAYPNVQWFGRQWGMRQIAPVFEIACGFGFEITTSSRQSWTLTFQSPSQTPNLCPEYAIPEMEATWSQTNIIVEPCNGLVDSGACGK